jgi:ribosomal protein L6P/L9E
MSRLAKKPIPKGKAEVSFSGDTLTVKGPKGTLTKRVHPSYRDRDRRGGRLDLRLRTIHASRRL